MTCLWSSTNVGYEMKLNYYVGRIVRLNNYAFNKIRRSAKNQGVALENCFLVASVSRKMHKLICYGANLRITVEASDVVLI